MPVTLTDVDLDDEDLDRLRRSDHPPDETVKRALALYDELDEADQLIHDCNLLGDT